MESGYSKAQSDNLPKVSTSMMADFFGSNRDFLSSEVRCLKAVKSCREDYGDNAIGYVQVKREGVLCSVQARITPEHKVRTKPYKVTFVCDEKKESIESCKCEDCPASQGGCKHASAFVSWLHCRTQEAAKTSTKCYWKKSKMSEIGSTIKFVTCKQVGNSQHNHDQSTNGSFLSAVVAANMHTTSTIINYSKDVTDYQKQGIYYLIEEFNRSKCGTTPSQFVDFAQEAMNGEVCHKICKLTKRQADCPLWHEARYGRITASRLYEAAHCNTVEGTLVKHVLGARVPQTLAMKRGSMLEGLVFKKLKKEYPTLQKCGIIISNLYPIFGASPDGVTEDLVLEIKCPSTSKWKETYFLNGRPNKKYEAQMQLQMLLADKRKAHFAVASPNFEETGEIVKCEIAYDENYTKDLLEKASDFWEKNIFYILFS